MKNSRKGGSSNPKKTTCKKPKKGSSRQKNYEEKSVFLERTNVMNLI